MSYQAWFKHFEEQLQGLTEAYDQSGSSLSLLGFALKEQYLSSDVYLKWAMTHYKLPMLQSRFFTKTSLSQEMFTRWATHYPWSEECLPVAEWDGSLIIAFLQPPQDFPSNPSSIYVLATFENLQQAWRKYHPEKEMASAVPTAKIDDAPAGIDLSMATVTRQNSSDSFSFDDLGMDDSSSDVSSDSNFLEEHSEETPTSEDLPDGLFDVPSVIRFDSLQSQKNSSDNEPENPPVTQAVAVAQESKLHSLKKPTSDSAAGEVTSPLINNARTKTALRSTGIVKPNMNPVVMGNLALEKIKKKNSVLLNEKIKTILSQMKIQFEKSLILTLDDQETQVVAFAWDESFQDAKSTSTGIPLKTPSIFNIVSSTQKSFHGYISPNKINENFFGDWNQGRIPEHVTITPIMINEKLVGMLMGFGTKKTYNKVSLSLAEKLSNDFVKGLQAA